MAERQYRTYTSNEYAGMKWRALRPQELGDKIDVSLLMVLGPETNISVARYDAEIKSSVSDEGVWKVSFDLLSYDDRFLRLRDQIINRTGLWIPSDSKGRSSSCVPEGFFLPRDIV